MLEYGFEEGRTFVAHFVAKGMAVTIQEEFYH
jgi:hypothetical protein